MSLLAAPPAPTGSTALLADLIRSVSRLSDVTEVLDYVPPMVTRLGFDRAIVSRIEDGAWMPAEVFVPQDSKWALDIRDAGRNSPQRLDVGTVEEAMIRSRRPIVVAHVQGNPRVNRVIAQASRSTAYLAAPVSIGDRVGGFLHVDRYWSRYPFDEADAAGLQAISDAVGLVLERAQLRACLDERTTPGGPNRAAATAVLTAREHQVAAMIADGLTNQQIAADLVVAESTVKSHVKHILRKLGARHRAEVVSMFLRSTA